MAQILRSSKHMTLLFVVWVLLLVAGLGVGLASGVHVLINGLGVTNLTNQSPWGLWIVVDLSSIALGAGAFTLSAAVYVFRLKHFEAIARAAVFVGLLGYTSAMLALLMDIGRPDRFYHPMIYWNIHSVLWEITLAVMLYTTVLVLEFVPIAIESLVPKRYHFLHSLAHFLHRVMPIIALIGMSISLIHQSSLGATYGILTARPIWYSPSAPVLFILSAIAGGPALTLFLALLSGVILNKEMLPRKVVKDVARLIGFAALAYLYLKLWSWVSTSYYSRIPEREMGLELLNLNTPYGFTFWWGEVLLGAIVPAIIMLWSRLRNNRFMLMLGCALVVLGLLIYRWNMTLSGFTVPLSWNPGVRNVEQINIYSPSLVEWGVTLGIFCYGCLAFTLGVRFLNLFPEAKPLTSEAEPAPAPAEQTPSTPQPQPSGAD